MKKLYKTLLACLLVVCCLTGLFACGNEDGGTIKTGLLCKKNVKTGLYTITGYVDEDKGVTSLDIDKELKALKGQDAVVGEIKAGAFKNNTTLKEVIVPNTVTKIGKGAFAGMQKLESLTLPFVGATRVADAFEGETAKTENKAIDSERSFGYIFGEEKFNYGAPVVFNYDAKNTITVYLPMSLSKVTISPRASDSGENSYAIPMYAFCGNAQVETIVLGENVKRIGNSAFKNGVRTKDVYVNEIERIYDNAFDGCANLNYFGLEQAKVDGTIDLQNLLNEEVGANAFANLSEKVQYTVLATFTDLQNIFDQTNFIRAN